MGNNTGANLTAAPLGSPDANGNLIGTASSPIDAKLAPLADNGGPTQTCALLAGSPAINAGSNPANLTTDQRGLPRQVGSQTDMGAYEAQLAVMSINPAQGPTSGGTPVTITGVAYTGATAVKFGNTSVAFHVDSDTQITATSPAGVAGTVDVTVVTASGTSATLAADAFTYIPATVSLTWSNPADITYGMALGSTQLDAQANMAGTYTYNPPLGTVLHVGNNQTLSVTFTPTDTTDYTTATDSVSINVTPAPLTITAVNQTKVYGAALPTLTVSYSGFVNGDRLVKLTTLPTLTTTATASSHVVGSPYAITASGAVDPDYTINYVAGTLTVTTAPLTITAVNQTKVYGAALPTLTASYSGFVNGDRLVKLTTLPTLTTTATASSHVVGSPYAITASGAVDPDYTINYVAGTLTVTTAPLTITAVNQTKVYGAALPTLTASYSGFVNGDRLVKLTTLPTLTTTATASSHVVGSPYAITASGAGPARSLRSFDNIGGLRFCV